MGELVEPSERPISSVAAMSADPEFKRLPSRATLVKVSLMIGGAVGAVVWVPAVIGTVSPGMILTNILFGLAFAVPAGAIAGLLSLVVGLILRAAKRRVARKGEPADAITAMVGVSATGLVLASPLAIGAIGELWPWLWIAVAVAVLSGIGIYRWSLCESSIRSNTQGGS
ncbi:hypothetical protein [Agromyces albus]|uniref:Uncharacterized protein n=1 Tax=Agromyces albus TaxID=205332 RepID=A0A4Q2L641_9MICO|nr:hypothetical protein [Agromyces albus]RXZ71882.1 hypothetical protein ESP51_07065 [Agromyces albus]